MFTSSHVGDEMLARDMMKFEGPPSWSPYVPKPITVKNYFTEDFNVSLNELLRFHSIMFVLDNFFRNTMVMTRTKSVAQSFPLTA